MEKLYLCDPKKNTECKKTCCYELNMNPQYGECKFTTDPRFRKNGHVYYYNEETHHVEKEK